MFKLNSGIQVISKQMQESQSISIGFFARVGLAQEPEVFTGMAHFLEHMLFKGTKKRSAKQITEEVDQIGAVINAQTAKEYTEFYMVVLPEHFEKALDILSDLFFSSLLRAEDIEKEKGVVLEEIYMVQDTPDDYVHDLYSRTLWPDTTLGNPILGTMESVSSINEESLKSFYDFYFSANNLLISVAGKLPDQSKLESILNQYCHLPKETNKDFSTFVKESVAKPSVCLLSKPIEQFHICMGSETVSSSDPDRYKYVLYSMILGGSMSSRLFQEIREKKGWAYSIGSYLSHYQKSGLFCIYGGVNQKKFISALKLIVKELDKLSQKQVTKKELFKVKQQLKGNMILSLESSNSWMNWQASSYMIHNRILNIDELVEKIDAVSQEDIQMIAQKVCQVDAMNLAAIGPLEQFSLQGFKGSFSDLLMV